MTKKRATLKTKKPKTSLPLPAELINYEPTIGLHQRYLPLWIPLLIVAVVLSVLSLKNSEIYVPETLTPPPADALYKRAGVPIETRLDDLLNRMSLDEKIGQMALVDKNSLLKLDDAGIYALGGVLSGAGAKPDNNTPKGWLEMVTGFQLAAQKSRLQIPLIYGLDSNHGHTNIPGATVFPHFIGLGASGNAELVQRVAHATAEELDATGVNWSFSPDLDAPKDIRWGRTYEAFSDDPNLLANLGQAYITGLQDNHTPNTFIMGTAKHFLGTGAMLWGQSEHRSFKIDQGTTARDDTALRSEYLPPYAAAAQADVASVMVGLQNWGDHKVIIDHDLITTMLKQELGFKGFVVSDWYGVYERAGNKYNATVKAINAGVDMAMLPYDYKTFVRDVHRAVTRGDIPLDRINDATRRILRQKFKAGLFNKPLKHSDDLQTIGSPAHRALARQAVAESAVLLKNNSATLPITGKPQSILVAGSGADNVGRQSGAWTVEWQGIDGNWLPGGTSILQAIREQARGTPVLYDQAARFPNTSRAPFGIVVVSEKPYAEGWGDNANPVIDLADMAAIIAMRKMCDKLIVVVVSGRPLLIDNERQVWDALVTAWLPGSEGGGVADVLFGKKPFTGKLPLPWPARVSQLPISATGITADGTAPTYLRGFGLSTDR